MKDKDEKLIKRLQQELDQSVDKLDASTLSRLRQARARALEERPHWFRRPVPVFSLAASTAALVLAVSLWIGLPKDNDLIADVGEIAMLSATEDMEFYEDLEFYQWLTNEEKLG